MIGLPISGFRADSDRALYVSSLVNTVQGNGFTWPSWMPSETKSWMSVQSGLSGDSRPSGERTVTFPRSVGPEYHRIEISVSIKWHVAECISVIFLFM